MALRLAGRLLRVSAGVFIGVFALWGALAISFDGPRSRPLAVLLAARLLAAVAHLGDRPQRSR